MSRYQTFVFSSLFYALIAVYVNLYGEIEELLFTWNAFKCQSPCIEQLKQHFGGIRGVQGLKVNGPGGIAEVTWDRAQPLSYEPFRYASSAVGFNISTMRVRVNGIVHSDGGGFYLISDDDGTRFNLIGPLKPEEGRYVPKYSLDTHPLSPAQIDRLQTLKRQGKRITIAGPLFLPSRYPLTLIAESIQEKP